MTNQEIERLIGEAWRAHRTNDNQSSAKAFRELLKEMQKMSNSEENLHQLVDIYYGLGLAERGAGNRNEAIEAFRKSYTLANDTLKMVSPDGINNLQDEEDDRFMMLGTMVKQRLAEMDATV
jgi:tetratricopeptide (TPR) repeat protein